MVVAHYKFLQPRQVGDTIQGLDDIVVGLQHLGRVPDRQGSA